MRVFQNQKALKSYLKTLENHSIGFVPTMGALHEGHLSLIRKSSVENDITVASIFVNPTQFNNASDLENYPIRTNEDILLLENTGCDILYLPDSKEDVYEGEAAFKIDLGAIATVMEGAFRPGHFEGVMRVVKLLLEIVTPQNAYFGLKDYQQYLVIQTMVAQLNMPTKIIGCEIIREVSGLAMSSRNLLLSDTEKATAQSIYKTLEYAQAELPHVSSIKALSERCLAQLKAVSEPEYFEIRNAATLDLVNDINNEQIRAFVVTKVGNVRLIDNLALNYSE